MYVLEKVLLGVSLSVIVIIVAGSVVGGGADATSSSSLICISIVFVSFSAISLFVVFIG